MFAYFLTSTFVAVATLIIISRITAERPYTHDWPVWVRVGVALVMGLLWPLLSLWAIGYLLSTLIAATCRWILGDHNKVRTRSMIASGDGIPGWIVGAYDETGRMRTDKR